MRNMFPSNPAITKVNIGMLYRQPNGLTTANSIPKVIELSYLRPNELLNTFRHLDLLSERVSSSSLAFDPIEPQTIELAKDFMRRMLDIIHQEELIWVAPRVTTNGDGDVSFEWWRDEHLLQISMESSGEVEYLRAWGPHIWQEMESGEQPSARELVELWNWLYF